MSDNGGFARLVPGFEFLQNLAKGAGTNMPGIGHWVAPTLDPEEIDKRIAELRTVKFWLEQNGRFLDSTIQALEVQRMTLNTLQTMNVQMSDLRDAMMIRPPAKSPAPQPSHAPAPFAPEAAKVNPVQAADPNVDTDTDIPGAASGPAAPGAIDPMQWWGALTKQFTTLATSALQNSAAPGPGTSDNATSRAAEEATGRRRPAKPRSGAGAKDSPAPRKKPARKTPGR